VTSDSDFKVTTLFEVEYKKNVRLKEKVAIAQEEIVYLTYGMVLCLVTLTDL